MSDGRVSSKDSRPSSTTFGRDQAAAAAKQVPGFGQLKGNAFVKTLAQEPADVGVKFRKGFVGCVGVISANQRAAGNCGKNTDLLQQAEIIKRPKTSKMEREPPPERARPIIQQAF